MHPGDGVTTSDKELFDNQVQSHMSHCMKLAALITTDRYGRTVGELYANGTNVQQQLVATGHARIYHRYAKPCAWAR